MPVIRLDTSCSNVASYQANSSHNKIVDLNRITSVATHTSGMSEIIGCCDHHTI